MTKQEDEENEEMKRLKSFPLSKDDDHKETTGVLLASEIKFYSESRKYQLISPFSEKQLRQASYELRVGDECSTNGEVKASNSSCVIVSLADDTEMPKFLKSSSSSAKSIRFLGIPKIS